MFRARVVHWIGPTLDCHLFSPYKVWSGRRGQDLARLGLALAREESGGGRQGEGPTAGRAVVPSHVKEEKRQKKGRGGRASEGRKVTIKIQCSSIEPRPDVRVVWLGPDTAMRIRILGESLNVVM